MTCGDRYLAVKVNCPARKSLYKSGTNGTTERDLFLSPDYHYNGKGNKNIEKCILGTLKATDFRKHTFNSGLSFPDRRVQ